MVAQYDDAVARLYRAPFENFVVVRKELAAELKASGDKAGALRLAKLARPTIAAWAVNQLWWEAREVFDELLKAGERLRAGELAASGTHRDALTKLRGRAATLLGAAGHAASEATLRRVATNLSALAASGGFDPDPPGALSGDRDPPGFDLAGLAALEAPAAPEPSPSAQPSADPSRAPQGPTNPRQRAEQERRRLEEERRRAEEERRRIEEERARIKAERRRLELALRAAQGDVELQVRQVERLRHELGEAEKQLEKAREKTQDLAKALEALGPPS
jgi:hypothetical protein